MNDFRKIALIACVKEKRTVAAKALDLYLGGDFKTWVEDARNHQVDQLYILSGKYGLLLPDQVIEPYDLNLNSVSEAELAEWGNRVISRLLTFESFANCHFILYANDVYASALIPHLGSFEIPFEIE